MAVKTDNSSQTFRFPSEHTIFQQIDSFCFCKDLELNEKIIKIAAQAFSNLTINQSEICEIARQIVTENAPHLTWQRDGDFLKNEKLFDLIGFCASLLWIVSDAGRRLWDPNAPGRPIVLYDGTNTIYQK